MNEPVRTPLAVEPAPRRTARKASAAAPERGRVNDPDRTMANILEVATAEFADKGLAGARIDEIAALTHTSKRMIYYYFGSKEGLYLAVLEEAYRRIRQIETSLRLEDMEPEAALRTLVGFTFDYQLDNPDFIRLVMNENMHRGEFIRRSATIQELNVPAINAVQAVYERGVTRLTCTCPSRPCASSMWPTATPSARSSSARSTSPRPWPSGAIPSSTWWCASCAPD